MWVTHTHIKEDQLAWPYNEKYGDRHISTLTMCAERQGACQSVPWLGFCHKHKSWPKRSHAWLHTHTLSHQLTAARSHRTFLLTQQGLPDVQTEETFIQMHEQTHEHTLAHLHVWHTEQSFWLRALFAPFHHHSLSHSHTHTHTARTHAHAHTQWGEVDYGLCGLFWNFQRLVARQQEELLYPVVIRWGERIERWRGEKYFNVI